LTGDSITTIVIALLIGVFVLRAVLKIRQTRSGMPPKEIQDVFDRMIGVEGLPENEKNKVKAKIHQMAEAGKSVEEICLSLDPKSYLHQIQKRKNSDPVERLSSLMADFLTSSNGFNAARSILGNSGTQIKELLLVEFIHFRYFTLIHHAAKYVSDDQFYLNLSIKFLSKIKSWYNSNPALASVYGSFENFQKNASERNNLITSGLYTLGMKEPGKRDETALAITSFLVALKINNPNTVINDNTVPAKMLILMKMEFEAIAIQMADTLKSMGRLAEKKPDPIQATPQHVEQLASNESLSTQPSPSQNTPIRKVPHWYYLASDNTAAGPHFKPDLLSLIEDGTITWDTYVWDGTPVESGGEWIVAREVL